MNERGKKEWFYAINKQANKITITQNKLIKKESINKTKQITRSNQKQNKERKK